MSYSPIVLRKIGMVVGLTATMIGLTGATIYVMIPWPYAAAVGFAAYFIIALVGMVWYMVRLSSWLITLEEVHTIVAETDAKVTELGDYVKRNS